MKERDIEHMWKVASNNPSHDTNWHDPVVIAFADLIRADEREACAKVIESHGPTLANGMMLAEAIRARGEQ
jgi:hypothetical protein